MLIKTLGLIAILLSTGCKLERQKEREHSATPGYRAGDVQRPARDLNGDERLIGQRICRDLRYKRNQWEVLTSSLELIFHVRARTQCSGGLMGYDISAELDTSGSDLIFDANSSSPFLNEVLTDLHPGLESVCGDLLSGQATISNTVEISGARYQVSFYEHLSTHYVLLTRFIQDSDSAWRAAVIDEAAVVVLERTSNAELIGVVNRRVKETRCTGTGSTIVQQDLRQILRNRI